uniref:ATP synthase complex subunit 8 n=1 Tax=Epicrionops cf. marmoratus UMMZ 190478 TaxID=1415577 RepID=W5RH94_9AMPH|nr:ATP synthase F0 subunit 8 [Epicrionops cf. marmoratus UMMZ 190478]
MPQLNPAPWLTIMLFSWVIFLTIIPTKVIKHAQASNVTSAPEHKHHAPWTWPWP